MWTLIVVGLLAAPGHFSLSWQQQYVGVDNKLTCEVFAAGVVGAIKPEPAPGVAATVTYWACSEQVAS